MSQIGSFTYKNMDANSTVNTPEAGWAGVWLKYYEQRKI